jgi:hypothetical protein
MGYAVATNLNNGPYKRLAHTDSRSVLRRNSMLCIEQSIDKRRVLPKNGMPLCRQRAGSLFQTLSNEVAVIGPNRRPRMALSEFESRRVEKLASEYVDAQRPPRHIRAELDIGFRILGQSLELFEIRPRWDNPKEIFEHSFAKTTFVKKTRSWKIYWMRQDLKWHRYDPVPEVASLEEFLATVSEDALACFCG